MSDFEDHVPEATTTPSDEAVLLCSCGWDSEVAKVGWLGHLPDSLDAAWQEAEAALREGWGLQLVRTVTGEYRAVAFSGVRRVDGLDADTPAAALRELARKLREAGRVRLFIRANLRRLVMLSPNGYTFTGITFGRFGFGIIRQS